MQFLVTTPDQPALTTTLLGVAITDGRGVLDTRTLKASLNRTPEQVADTILREWSPGYQLEPMDDEARAWMSTRSGQKVAAPPVPTPAKKSTHKSKTVQS